jgi:hypothetical protein
MELHEQLALVTDEATFLAFVAALIDDRRASDAGQIDECGRSDNGWENHSIEDFLEAAYAWGESTNIGEKQGLQATSPWMRFATFLYCGKIYE